MNSSIQKFDIRFMMQEKLDELTQVRGMSDEAARALIVEAVSEWRGAGGPPVNGVSATVYAVQRGTIIIREIKPCEIQKEDCVFKKYGDAAQYIAGLTRGYSEHLRQHFERQ